METLYVYFKSDFTLQMTNEVDWSTPFRIKFWTTRAVSAMEISYDGETYTGCRLGSDGKVYVPFNNFAQTCRQGLGKLKMEVTYIIEDESYPDGTLDQVMPAENVICEDANGNDVYLALGLTGSEDLEISCAVVAAYQRGDTGNSAYEDAVAQGYDGTLDEWLASLHGADADVAAATAATEAANTAATLANTKAALADTAATSANTAATLANTKADLAETAANSANNAATNANTAAALANAAAETANEAAVNADASVQGATEATQAANDAAALANTKAALADTAAENANTKAGLANTAATSANDAAAAAVAQTAAQATAYTNAEAARDTAYQNAESSRNTAYQSAEDSRDATFDSKEAARDAANEAATNAASSIAALQTEVNAIGPKIDGFVPQTLTIEQGTITTNGESTSTKRLRTNGYINYSTIKVTCTNGRYYLFGYDSNDDLVQTSSGVWQTTTQTISFDGAVKYRLIFSNTSDTDLTPSDFAALGISIYGYDSSLKEAVTTNEIADNLTTNDATKVLSAKQGTILGSKVEQQEQMVQKDTSDDALEVVDGTGRTGFKVDSQGPKARVYNICDSTGTIVATISAEFLATLVTATDIQPLLNSVLPSDATGKLEIIDGNYNVVARIDSNGFKARKINICDSNGTILKVIDENLVGVELDTFKFPKYVDSNGDIMSLNTSPSLVSMIHQWGFIGGSTSSGCANYRYKDGVSVTTSGIDIYDFSIGQRLCALNGVSGTNFSKGGMTAKTWCNRTDGYGWDAAQLDPKQAYIIDLGANDSNSEIDVGDLSTDVDLSDYANNADTFAGWLAGIVQRIRSISPKAFIFMMTSSHYLYPDTSNYIANGFIDVVRALPSFFANVYTYDRIYLIDKSYHTPTRTSALDAYVRIYAHPSTFGYQYETFIVNTLIDDIIRKNLADFLQVGFVLPINGHSYDY